MLGSLPHLGPVETLSYAAACTERLRLGCAVFVTPLHSPLHLAKSVSSLDQLSRGRVEVGVGTGGGFRMFSAFGVDGQHFVARFTEGLELMRAMWTRDRVDFDGRFWQARVVREALAEQGRDPATFRLGKRVYLGVDDDASRARQRTGEALNDRYGYFGMKGVERAGVAGTPGDVAAELDAIAAAGTDLILLNPLFDEATQMERLAAEVLPQLA